MKKFWVYYTIIVFSIIIIPFTIDKQYYIPQYIILFLSPLLVLTKAPKMIDLVLALLGVVMLSTYFTHPENFRFSTIAYSLLNFCMFSCYYKLFPQSNIKPVDFQKLIKYILYSFAVVLAIQDVSRLAGITPFNESYNIYNGFKFNSLSFEASQTGAVVTVLMYAYIKLEELKLGRRIDLLQLYHKHRWVLFSYLFVSVFSLSVACLFSLAILSLYFVSSKYGVAAFVIISISAFLFFSIGSETGNRILALFPLILTGDVDALFMGDASSSARIAPALIYLREFDFFSFDTWLGHGCDYGRFHTWQVMTGRITDDTPLSVGGMIFFLFDYGLLPFIIFLYFVRTQIKFKSFTFLLFASLFIFNGLNFYSTWLFFIVIYSINYYQKWKSRYQLSLQHSMQQKH